MDDATKLLRALGLTAPGVDLSGGGGGARVLRHGEVVIKSYGPDGAEIAASEVRSLRLLHARGVPVPEVLGQRGSALALPWIPPGPRHSEDLGRAIARMHRERSPGYGCEAPLTLAGLRLPPGDGRSWEALWWDHRVAPLLRRAEPLLGSIAPRVERLVREHPQPIEGPMLLHGDLWSGNVLHGRDGPVLIDPSSWWGERVVDLAMMQLFGGFDDACWRAYSEAFPIPPEVERTILLHQLYPLLAHVCLFGSSYVSAIERVLRHYGR